MKVTGASTHSGATTISAGSLHLASGATLGTGELTIASGATFLGVTSSKVALTNSKTTISGTLQVGSSLNSTTGLLDFGGNNVTFNKNSVYQLVVRKCAAAKKSSGGNGCAMIDNVGTLRMNGVISVRLASGYSLQAGDSVRIFSANRVTGSPSFELPELEGLEWDTTHWKEGFLHLKALTDDIVSCHSDMPVSVDVYTVGGYRMTTFKCVRGEVERMVKSKCVEPSGICVLHIRGGQTCEQVKWVNK